LNCGSEGEIEVRGLAGDADTSKVFRYRGHNPFSGHMHYQCPACEIVLLVDPMTVLGKDTISAISQQFLQETGEGRWFAGLPPRDSFIQKA
jgi:hypothetical protein